MIYKYNEEIISEEISGEGMLLYNSKTKETHVLNDTATLIFKLCDGNDLKTVTAEYLNYFAKDETASAEEIAKDCQEIIDAFLQKDIFFVR